MPQHHRPELSGIVGAQRLTRRRRSPRTFGRDRICAHRGCRTRLSIYNSGPTCSVHAQPVPEVGYGQLDPGVPAAS